jgi:deazaflavin-dependent oxidoreductase (nitroreductase family)
VARLPLVAAPHLKRVDPNAPSGPLRTAYNSFLRTSAGRWTGINVASRVDPWLLKKTGGRVGLGMMITTALLETTGARSGAPRSNPVVYFHDGDDVVLIASSFGRDKHPAWFHNLRANPSCRLGGEDFTAAIVEDEDERARLFALADKVYPGYADYRERTAKVGRRIPVLRLTPA